MAFSKAKTISKELLPPIALRLIRSVRPKKTKNRQKSLDTKTSSRERGPEYYNEVFLSGSRKHYKEGNHYGLWSVLVDRLTRAKVESVLDIGCGSGALALFLRDKGLPRYLGFDFSIPKIEWARTICPEFDFVVADVFKTDLFHSHDYDTVVSTEFLEHIEHDLDVVGKIRTGTRFYGTVPNFPGHSHVRHFTSTQEVYDRYGRYFQAFSVDEFLGVHKGRFYLLEGIKV
jgi:2-polyprenyl-3-methyl-5-hydroxy-6-metoxy-1,4-benzoquinol methylase